MQRVHTITALHSRPSFRNCPKGEGGGRGRGEGGGGGGGGGGRGEGGRGREKLHSSS